MNEYDLLGHQDIHVMHIVYYFFSKFRPQHGHIFSGMPSPVFPPTALVHRELCERLQSQYAFRSHPHLDIPLLSNLQNGFIAI